MILERKWVYALQYSCQEGPWTEEPYILEELQVVTWGPKESDMGLSTASTHMLLAQTDSSTLCTFWCKCVIFKPAVKL